MRGQGLSQSFTMTILEFLTTTTWAGIVWTRHLFANDRLTTLLSSPSGILLCSLLLGALDLVDVVFLLLITLCMLFGSSFLYLLALYLHRDLASHEEAGYTGVHVIDHRIPKFGTLEFEDQ